jgi:hypothetical protein
MGAGAALSKTLGAGVRQGQKCKYIYIIYIKKLEHQQWES